MAQLTPQEYSAKLRAQAKALSELKPLQVAAQTVHAMRVERIFDTTGVGGSYSRKPIYVSDKNLRRAGPHKGKTGKTIKSSYFKDGYYGLKKNQGFDPNIVNMRLTNDLQSDFANSQKTNGTGTPPAGKVIKVNNGIYIEALRRGKNVQKLNANIKRFGNFIAFTKAERDEFHRIIALEFKKLME